MPTATQAIDWQERKTAAEELRTRVRGVIGSLEESGVIAAPHEHGKQIQRLEMVCVALGRVVKRADRELAKPPLRVREAA